MALYKCVYYYYYKYVWDWMVGQCRVCGIECVMCVVYGGTGINRPAVVGFLRDDR